MPGIKMAVESRRGAMTLLQAAESLEFKSRFTGNDENSGYYSSSQSSSRKSRRSAERRSKPTSFPRTKRSPENGPAQASVRMRHYNAGELHTRIENSGEQSDRRDASHSAPRATSTSSIGKRSSNPRLQRSPHSRPQHNLGIDEYSQYMPIPTQMSRASQNGNGCNLRGRHDPSPRKEAAGRKRKMSTSSTFHFPAKTHRSGGSSNGDSNGESSQTTMTTCRNPSTDFNRSNVSVNGNIRTPNGRGFDETICDFSTAKAIDQKSTERIWETKEQFQRRQLRTRLLNEKFEHLGGKTNRSENHTKRIGGKPAPPSDQDDDSLSSENGASRGSGSSKSSKSWSCMTATERLDANFNALESQGLKLIEATQIPCVKHNLFRVCMDDLLRRPQTCHACMTRIQTSAVLRNGNKYACPGRILGGPCDQIHSYSFCQGIIYSKDVHPLNHCQDCKKCVSIRAKHCYRCDHCYVYSSEVKNSICPCTNPDGDEILDENCTLC